MSAQRPPDLGVAGKLYIGLVFLGGTAAVVDSLHTLATAPIGYQWLLLAALTWFSGPFAVKVPAITATISVSEAFIFTLILMFGGAPATVTVALDGLAASWYRGNRQTRRLLFNFAEPAITTWVAAKLFFWTAGITPLAFGDAGLGELFLPVVVLASSYFFMNGWLTALAVTAETGTPPHQVWRSHFVWLSLNYFGGASIALLLALNMRQVTLASLGVVVPLLVILYVTFKNWAARLDDANEHLRRLNELYMATVESLAMAVDAKDQVTHGHIRRVQTYSVGLARALGIRDELELRALEAAALLHDMGKLAVPDYILNKPGKLTPSEYEKMKLHASAGAEILAAVRFPYPVVPIVRHHHENWDGTGYPDNLRGIGIPIGARILSVIDCYDALTSDRPYRRALSHDESIAIIRERRGTMYDPAVVDTFIAVHSQIRPAEIPTEPPTALAQLAPSLGALKAGMTESAPADQPVASTPRAGLNPSIGLTGEILRLRELVDVLATHADLDDAIELIARHLRRVMPASLVGLYLTDKRAERLCLAHASGLGDAQLRETVLPLGAGVSGWVAVNGTSITNADPGLDFGPSTAAGAPALASALSTPLKADGELIGVLTLYAEERDAFTEDHRLLVETVAHQVATTVRRVASREETRSAELTDQVTGLPNAKYLNQLLSSRGFTQGHPTESLGVTCLKVHGTHAQAPGGSEPDPDQIMRVATAVCRSIRVADLLFRGGPDELVVLMPSCDPDTGDLVMSRLSSYLSSPKEGAPAPLPVAVGFACAPFDGQSVAGLVRVARRRMLDDRAETTTSGAAEIAPRRSVTEDSRTPTVEVGD